MALALEMTGHRPVVNDPEAWLYRMAINVIRARWRRALVARRFAHRRRCPASAAPPGTLFALESSSGLVWFSTDRGARWRQLMPHKNFGSPASARLAGANANSRLLTDEAINYVSHNNSTSAPVAGVTSHSVAKERLWLVTQGQVQIRTSYREPVHTSALPAPARRVVALSAEAALAETTAGEWYYTYDSGVRWTPRPHPCPAITSVAAPLDRSVRTLYPGGQLYVSTTTVGRGSPAARSTPCHCIRYPRPSCGVPGKAPPCTGTVDGAGFETVFADAEGGFTALDAETALRLDAHAHPHLTRDGGRTWTEVRW